MDEKKSEASGKDVEQLGPYQLHEQVAQDELRSSAGSPYWMGHPPPPGAAPCVDMDWGSGIVPRHGRVPLARPSLG